METDILIIGAGLTGLNAAREIHETAPDLRVLVTDAGGGDQSLIVGLAAAGGKGDLPGCAAR